VVFYLEACIKIRDKMALFNDFNSKDCIYNSHHSKYSKAWEKVTLIKLDNTLTEE
jgi:hypothetical protein